MNLNSTIILRTARVADVELPLSDIFTEFDGHTFENIVYQDANYEFILRGTALKTTVSKVRLYVNDKRMDVKFSLTNINGESQLNISPQNSQPFLLLYGIIEIAVLLVYSDTSEQYLFSPYLAVAIKQDNADVMVSIKEMLDDIYQKNHALLHRKKTQSSNLNELRHQISENKFAKEISLLKTILVSFKNLFSYFSKNPYTTTVPEHCVDSFEKLHTIQSKNLVYIATHPEQFRISYIHGISFGQEKFLPEKTLISTQQISYDTLENQTILSFINTLYVYVSNKVDELLSATQETESSIGFAGTMLEHYILSSTIIYQYTQYALQEHLAEMRLIQTQLSDTFIQFQRVLPCSFQLLNRIPAPTPPFLEIYHYRQIYELITLWFSTGGYETPTRSQILHFSSADIIYEYFCLLELYDTISDLGFTEQVELRTTHDYKCTDPRYTSPKNANTFHFTNGNGCELTLYYQPIIFSSDSPDRNKITLFRTDRNYYSPDFVLKRETASGIEYGILDAKWRPRKYLRDIHDDSGLAALSYKYLYSIVDEQTSQSASFFWLLQGKDDNSRTYFHHQGAISNKRDSKFVNSTGIVRLSPKYGNYELSKILKIFLCD